MKTPELYKGIFEEPTDMDFGEGPTTPAAVATPESFETALPAQAGKKEVKANGHPVITRPAGTRTESPRAEGAESRNLVGPASIEAERAVLGAIILDAPTALPLVREAGLTEWSFSDIKVLRKVFSAITATEAAGFFVEVGAVAEEAMKLIEGENVYLLLSTLMGEAATEAGLRRQIEKVRECEMRRGIIDSSRRAIEAAATNTETPEEIADSLSKRLTSLSSSSASIQTDRLQARAFDPAKKIPKPNPIFELAGTTICTPGNLTTLYSQAKTGKSSLIGAMLGAAMTTPDSPHDTLSVTGPNYADHAVLHFDTEQSPYDWQQLIDSSLRRVEVTTPPDWLLSYTLTGLGARDCMSMVESALRLARKKFGGIHSVIIDGVADLVVDPNDPDECFPLITRLHALAIEYNTAIISVLHMNPGSEVKGRGHLGSQLERKSESNLTLTKNGDVTTISSNKQRGKAIGGEKAPSFRWSDEHQMHRSCKTAPVAEKSKGGRPEVYPYSVYAPVFPKLDTPGLPLTQLAKVLSVNKPINPKQLFNVLQRWAEEGAVEIIPSPSGNRYRQAI